MFLKATVREDGTYSVTKHFAMGRTSVELSFVMPDNQTVYIMDDGTNRVMTVYKAETPGDLSSGTLYAAKVMCRLLVFITCHTPFIPCKYVQD